MQSAGDVHETDRRSWIFACRTDGTGWMVHCFPFHSSASASPSVKAPTAMHIVALGHETPSSSARLPWGVTGSRTLHVWPFHSSASVVVGLGFPALPTAMHMAGEAQETAASAVPWPGLGVC